jgi:hypothetical protein
MPPKRACVGEAFEPNTGVNAMSTIKATWRSGQVQLDGPANWPDGRRLVVSDDPLPDIEFMSEAEQSDDPEAIEQWIKNLELLPAPAITPAQQEELAAWRKKMKEFNLDAVRRQMEEGIP